MKFHGFGGFSPYFWKRPYRTKRINSYESYSSKLDLTSPGAPHQIRHLYQSKKKDGAKQREKLHLHSPPCIAVQSLIWAPRRILATPVGLLFAKLPAYYKSHISPKMIQSSKYKSVNGTKMAHTNSYQVIHIPHPWSGLSPWMTSYPVERSSFRCLDLANLMSQAARFLHLVHQPAIHGEILKPGDMGTAKCSEAVTVPNEFTRKPLI